MKTSFVQSRHTRTGAAAIEMLTAGVLLTTVMAFLVPFVGRVSSTSRDIADREWALREVQNLIVLSQSGQTPVTLSTETQARLLDADLKVEQTALADEGMVSTTYSLSWVNQFGERVTPVALTSWNRQGETP